MKKKWIVTILAMCLSCLTIGALSACTGEQGPQGEKGEQGIPGIQGEAGKDGITPTIEVSDDGYWVINGEKTEHKAVGQDGADGQDGTTPEIWISTDGYWVINGEKTQYEAVGHDGADGQDGKGIISVAYDDAGNLVITYTDYSVSTIVFPEKIEHKHSYGEWIRYSEDRTNCEKVFFYRICKECNSVDWKMGSGADHVWSKTYAFNSTYHWFACENCNSTTGYQEHTLDADGNCTICNQFIGGVHYELSADGAYAKVVDYDGIGDNVNIAEEYQGVPVTTIGDSAFLGDQNIGYVFLPETIVTIEDFAFSDSSLMCIELSESVKTIGEGVFWGCYNLSKFEISKNIETIGAYAFADCKNIHLTVDDGNQYFKVVENDLYSKDGSVLYFYNDCDGLRTSFTIPDTVKTIATSAFYNCVNLRDLTISSSVVEIQTYAFTFYSTSRLNEIIFEEPSGWICTPIEEGGKTYELDASYVKNSGRTALRNHVAYNWKRT